MDPRQWKDRLGEEASRDLLRRLPAARAEGEDLVDLGSNDYLGLSRHPRVVGAARAALLEHGAGAGAARLLRGHTRAHEALESALAALKGTEAALVFASGYATNLGLLSSIADEGDAIFCDRLDHASLVDGARMSRARVYFYDHDRLDRLEAGLRRVEGDGHRWIVTDGVFGMDGRLAPLPELLGLARAHDATLVVDDAHATGVIGPAGAGSCAHFGLDTADVIQMGTLSKALGSQGGYVAASRACIDWLVQHARAFVYSTGLAPSCAAAAREALDVVRDEPHWNERLQLHLTRLREGLAASGWRVMGEAPCPMLAVWAGEPGRALALSARLRERGVIAPAIRPPTVPRGTSRLRLAPRASHGPEEIDRVLEAFGRAGD